jgi:hypothetical protein
MADGYIGEEALAAPDLLDYVIGVRGFARIGHSLASPFQSMPWPRPDVRAECEPSAQATRAAFAGLNYKPGKVAKMTKAALAQQARIRPHRAPHVDCSCGIYAYHDPDADYLTQPIVGIVRAKGRLIVHTGGFRAESAEVIALAFDPDLGDGVQAQRFREVTRRACAWWRVPLLTRDALVASFGEFGSPVPMNLRPQPPKEEEAA